MDEVVRDPVGELIASEQGFQLRWHNGHVYGFGKQYSTPTDPHETPGWTGWWEVTDFGSPQRAKNVYPKLWQRINEVCGL